MVRFDALNVAAAAAATFSASNRTIGWFDPLPVGGHDA